MPSIDDFVKHRYADAQEELRKLDPDYVRLFEETARMQASGLDRQGTEPSPRARLSTEWHRLLEDCWELRMQASILQAAIDCYSDDCGRGLSDVEIGKRLDYHLHSGIIHINTLAERIQGVIKKTTDLYISNREVAHQIATRHNDDVYDEVIKKVKALRDQVSHGGNRSWAETLTRDNLWEQEIAAGRMIPLESFYYPGRGRSAKSRSYDVYVEYTNRVFESLGGILHKLEEDIATHNA